MKELVLWVTTDCNLRCRYCYAGAGADARPMEWPVARRAVDAMAACSDGFTIQFAGGEPLLNLDLIGRLVRYTDGMRVRRQVQTNATLMDRPTAARLKAWGVAVGVSLDGLPAVNDRLRPFPDGSGSTDAVIAGVESLRAEGVRTGMTCVLSAQNVPGLPGLVELVSYLGNIAGISLDALRPVGEAAANGVGQADPLAAARSVTRALLRADELAAAGGARVGFREEQRIRYLLSTGKERRHRCNCDAGQSLLVKPDGEAYPCPSLTGYPELRLGNVMEEWFIEGLESRTHAARERMPRPVRCAECGQRRLCGGPCPAQSYAQSPIGRENLVECSVKRACIAFLKEKEKQDSAAKN